MGFSPYRKAGTAISPKTRILVLFAITAVVGLVFAFVPQFAQPQSYHSFADRRAFFGIANSCDVASNLPFAVIGFLGIVFLLQPASSHNSIPFIDPRERWPYLIAFLGIFLTAFGSSYYHLDPNNARLVWDRLPIMVAFTATAAAMVTERVQIRLGFQLLPVFLSLGVASVLLWYSSELHGAGDLRFYAAVQVCSTLVLLIVLLFPARYTRGSDLAIIVGLYALAKLFESFDKQIFHFEPLVSGHTLKHLVAAAAGYWLLRMLRKRQPAT